jgi:hypothetical protein
MSKQKHVSLTATLQTTLAAALFRILPKEYNVIKVDCPVSLRPWLPYPVTADSMGCFIDSFSVNYHRGPFSWHEAQRTKDVISAVLQEKGADNLCGKIRQISNLRQWLEGQMGQERPSTIELSNLGMVGPSLAYDGFEIESVLFSQSAGACNGAIKVSTATG